MTRVAVQTAKRATYPAYKPSGMDWVGDIPEHWIVIAVKRYFEIQLGKMLQNAPTSPVDTLVPYLKALHVQWGSVQVKNLPEMWASREEVDQYGVLDGDLLVCEGGEVGRAGFAVNPPKLCIMQNALHRVRVKKSGHVSYLMYVLYGVKSAGWFDVLCNKATIAHFTGDKFSELQIPLPPLPEQRAIAAFLDRETVRIDALIEKKQRQIELLQEKRAALINHAVTKGLDPNAKMKDSGVEWLGNVPEHWEVKRLKFISTLQTGLTLGKKYANRDLVSRPYLRVANVQDGYLDLETITEIQIPFWEVGRYELQKGDVLMTEGGDFDKLGRGYVWENQIPGCLHQNHIFAVRPDAHTLDPHFLSAMLTSSHGKNYFISTSQQTTNLASTNSTKLRSFPVPLPPLVEQVGILEQVKNDCGHLETMMGKVILSIDLLREYRSALISAAVTGKIDVRQESG